MGTSLESAGRGSSWRIAGWSALAVLLLLPAVAMQFTDQFAWDETDFLVMGLLLGAVGLAFELAVRLTRKPAVRAAAAFAILAAAFLVWVELAVGIFGPG